MSVTRINNNLPATTKISTLSEQVLEIFGLVEKARFDENEITQLTTDFGLDRKYLRNQSLGHTLSTYVGWTHLHSESGYSIWKFSPTNYKYNSVNELYLSDVVLENRGEANSESDTTFDKVFLDEGSVYTDNTTEAGSEDGTSFSLMNDTSDYLYLGLSTTFSGISFEFDTRGSNYTLDCEYWNGSAWVTLDVSGATYADDTSNFESDGRIYWTIPSNWATTTVNSIASKYWVRISTSTVPVTTALAYIITPANSVISLLKMSSEEILNEDWAWCSYTTAIYVTIRNSGVASYEGNFYITSASSTVNKQNYFIHNHEFTADYEDSTYIQGALVTNLDDLSDVFVSSGLTNGQILIWDSAMSLWRNADSSMEKTTLDSLKDVMVSSGLSNGQVLTWDSGDNMWRNASILETVSHTDLSDMPDSGGTNSDHDARYYTETETNSLLSNKQNLDSGLTSLAGLTYTATAFVKYTGADTFTLDINTYSLSSHTHTLDELSDVSIGSGGPLANQILRYTIAYGWHNWTPNYLISSQIDDTKGNGDTTYVWSADKVYDELVLKANLNSPTFTGTVSGITATMVGLGNVTNNAQYYAGGTDVAILDGGTGASLAQDAINNLTSVTSATNEYVLTKDTATGNATWKISVGASMSLDQLSDVMVSSGLIDGQGLYWDAGDAMWRNISPVEGVTSHPLLTSLDYASAGHTGFEQTLTFSQSLSRSVNTITLLNDSGTPGNTKYYGTDGSGTKGWYTLSTSSTLDSLTDVVVNSGITDKDILAWDSGDSVWRNRTTTDLGVLTTTTGVKNNGTVNPTNLLSNGNFENWSAGTAVAPDGWTLGGAGASVAREATIIKQGTYSAKLTRAGTDCSLKQSIHTTKGIAYWKGRKITISKWVYATVANRARIIISDAVGSTASSYHTGDSTWQLLTTTRTIDSSATEVTSYCYLDSGDTSAYFDGAMCVEGESPFAFSDKPAGEGVWANYFTQSTITGWAASPTGSIWLKKIGKTVFVFYNITGTSDQTYARFTVPYTPTTLDWYAPTGYIVDNSTPVATPGLISVDYSTNIVNIYKTSAGGTWTNSGTKTCIGQFWYETS